MSDKLITRYRPTEYDAVIGHGSVLRSLEVAVKEKRSHAYLFTGESGLGKTTLARCTAYKLGATDREIQEIDAATNTGIEAMRQVTSGLIYRPIGPNQIKAIVVDECHSLSKQAWQSLLKILEEPPAWVYWFLCTTDASKVPVTVKRRCFAYDLKPIKQETLFKLLVKVADQEGMKASDSVLDVCIREANGSPGRALANLGVCANARDKQEALDLLSSALDNPEAIELARALYSGSPWKIVRPILERLTEMNPESIRYVVKAYIAKAMLGNENERGALKGTKILDAFSQPFGQNEGISSIVLAVGRVLFA